MTAGAIAVGLVLSEAIMRILKIRKKIHLNSFHE
jgi:hypothetical protein